MLHVAVFVLFSALWELSLIAIVCDVICGSLHPNSLVRKNFTANIWYQVGKEIIGTTVNTLLFAYLGEILYCFPSLQTQKYSLEIILNSRFLSQDVAIMLFGAIACLIAVPVSIKCIIWQIRHINPDKKQLNA